MHQDHTPQPAQVPPGPRGRSRRASAARAVLGWTLWLLAPMAFGALCGATLPSSGVGVPFWLVTPFALLIVLIALMPLVAAAWWHRHHERVALGLGGVVAGYWLTGMTHAGMTHAGPSAVAHTAAEYFSFIALVGGLYVVSGNILVDLRGRGRPLLNTLLLACGAVIANLVGTTGASMLLVRPFMRINHGRLRPIHMVFFIFIVSNCGGVLTPVGDPPLYLGYLRGIPFLWDPVHFWPSWLLVNGCLLALFYAADARIERRVNPADVQEHALSLRVSGTAGLVALPLIIGGTLIDPVVSPWVARAPGLHGLPIGGVFQVLVASAAMALSSPHIRTANDFHEGPLREVCLLFAGIFLTMMPALAYLAEHGKDLGLGTATGLYFATGSLSAVLDNAPTYLNFLQIAYGPAEMTPEGLRVLIATPEGERAVVAVSTGAVFFGAMTYIGNGPNLLVKSLAEHRGLKMPAFFAYAALAAAILLPVLVLHWLVLIR